MVVDALGLYYALKKNQRLIREKNIDFNVNMNGLLIKQRIIYSCGSVRHQLDGSHVLIIYIVVIIVVVK